MNSSFVGSISISWPIAILASVSSAAKHKTAHAPIVLKRTAIGCGFTEFALARKSEQMDYLGLTAHLMPILVRMTVLPVVQTGC